MMLTHLLAVLGLGLACATWVLVQVWIARRDPQLPGLERECDGGCGGKGACGGARCDSARERSRL